MYRDCTNQIQKLYQSNVTNNIRNYMRHSLQHPMYMLKKPKHWAIINISSEHSKLNFGQV